MRARAGLFSGWGERVWRAWAHATFGRLTDNSGGGAYVENLAAGVEQF